MGVADTRFVIPVFQRVYSWDARQCNELWEDIMSVGEAHDENADPHFMGMLLYAADTESWHGVAQLNVIDGQQRMTTLTLLLCALARYLDEANEQVAGVGADELFERYLRVSEGENATGKLVLSFMDCDTLYALVGVGVMPNEPAGRLIDNLELFYAKMCEPGFDVEQLWRGLGRLEVADILLDHDDSPQLVFESLNSKGMALSTADCIRNLVVVTDEANGCADGGVFERVWKPLEQLLASSPDGLDVTNVVHAWLAGQYRDTRIFDKSEVYGLFKSRLREEYRGDLNGALTALTDYARKLVSDDDLRAKSLADAERWVAGKPKELISEYKMFGD